MNWSVIKKAVNSTLGTDDFKPLDQMVKSIFVQETNAQTDIVDSAEPSGDVVWSDPSNTIEYVYRKSHSTKPQDPYLLYFRTETEYALCAENISTHNGSFFWENGAAYRGASADNWLQIDKQNGFADGSKYKFVKIRYRVPQDVLENGHSPYASLFWRTSNVDGDNVVDPILDNEHILVTVDGQHKVQLINDGQYHTLVFDLSSDDRWDGGTVTLLRWQFSDPLSGNIYISQFGMIDREADLETYEYKITMLVGEETEFWVKGSSDGMETPFIRSIDAISNDGVITYDESGEFLYITAINEGTAMLKVVVGNTDLGGNAVKDAINIVTITVIGQDGDTGNPLDETVLCGVGIPQEYRAHYDTSGLGVGTLETGILEFSEIKNNGVISIIDSYDDVIIYKALKSGTAVFNIRAENTYVTENDVYNVESEYTLTIISV